MMKYNKRDYNHAQKDLHIPEFKDHPIHVPVIHEQISPGEITLKLILPPQAKGRLTQLQSQFNGIKQEITAGTHREIAYCSLWYQGHLLTAIPIKTTPTFLPDQHINHRDYDKNVDDQMISQVEQLISLTFEKLGIPRKPLFLDRILQQKGETVDPPFSL